MPAIAADAEVSAGNRAQADREASALFQLVDLHGGGQLIEMAREARLNGRYAELDRAIRDKVRPYLYNGDGRARLVPVDELVHARRCYRLGQLARPPSPSRPRLSVALRAAARPPVPTPPPAPPPRPQLRFVPSAWEERPAKSTVAAVAAAAAAAAISWLPQKKRNSLQPLTSVSEEGRDTSHPLPTDDRQAAGSVADADASARRRRHPGDRTLPVCWNLYKRGPVGETILHLCLLQASSAHETLARRLLLAYPDLMHDVYVSDQYYGESVLHMAVVNEDPAMVRFLLKRDAAAAALATAEGTATAVDEGWRAHRLHARRCCGEFFCAADQKNTRRDLPNGAGDWVTVSEQTNYGGHAYFGEYALSFAACLGQEECARVLVACGADVDAQDHNGNTALHMAVVRDRMRMYDVLRALGASTRVKNRQSLTPLALAARLGKRAAYEHIIAGERRPYWTFGAVVCSAYPLSDLDSIGDDGRTNRSSVVELVARGALPAHADMVDGPVVCLLEEKWRAFARRRFYRSCALFCAYFALFFVAMYMRVLAVPSSSSSSRWEDALCGQTGNSDAVAATSNSSNTTSATAAATLSACFCSGNGSGGGGGGLVRAAIELAVLAGAVAYLAVALHELRREGRDAFGAALRHAPDKLLFHCSCAFVVCLVPLRLVACAAASSAAADAEQTLATLAMLCTAPYFLFFCRGVRAVGPFVLMIFRMVLGDMMRFCVIYAVFIAGFSQSMHIVFAGYAKQQLATTTDLSSAAATFSDPLDAMMGMLYLATGQLQAIHDSISRTRHPQSGAVVFVLYLWLAVVLLVNMLVAMMSNTFKLVSETRKEWLRQWANIILVIELSVPPEERRQLRRNYSQPLSGGGGECEERALVVRERAPDAATASSS